MGLTQRAWERHRKAKEHGSSALLGGITPRPSPITSGSMELPSEAPKKMWARLITRNTSHGCTVLAAHHLAAAGKCTYQSDNQGRILFLIIPFATH